MVELARLLCHLKKDEKVSWGVKEKNRKTI